MEELRDVGWDYAPCSAKWVCEVCGDLLTVAQGDTIRYVFCWRCEDPTPWDWEAEHYMAEAQTLGLKFPEMN